MLYSFDVAIPANTAKTAAVEQECKVSPGTVVRLMVVFPPGCAKLAHVKILAGGHQVWPGNPDGDLAGDSEIIDVPEDYLIERGRFYFTVRAWNDDDTYQHTVVVRFAIERPIRGFRRVTAFVAFGR